MKYIKEYKTNSLNEQIFMIADKQVKKFLENHNWLWDYYMKVACEIECFIGLRGNKIDDETYFTSALYYTANGDLRKHENGYDKLIKFNIPTEPLNNSTLFVSVKAYTEYGTELTYRVEFGKKNGVKDAIKQAERRIEIVKKLEEILKTRKNSAVAYNMDHDKFELQSNMYIDLSDTSKIMVDLNR